MKRDARTRRPQASAGSSDDPESIPSLSLGYLIRETHRAFLRSLQMRIAPHGVTIGQWFFLRVLWEEDGLTQRELSLRVGMMEPTTVTALNGMEKRNLVKRVRHSGDRRKIQVFLTEKGRRLRNVLLPYAADVNRAAARGVPERDVARFREILTTMKRNLDLDAFSGSRTGLANGRRPAGVPAAPAPIRDR